MRTARAPGFMLECVFRYMVVKLGLPLTNLALEAPNAISTHPISQLTIFLPQLQIKPLIHSGVSATTSGQQELWKRLQPVCKALPRRWCAQLLLPLGKPKRNKTNYRIFTWKIQRLKYQDRSIARPQQSSSKRNWC